MAIQIVSDKVKLYEMREKNLNLPHTILTKPVVYVDIKKINLIENKRKNLNVFPFRIKQRNLEKFIVSVLSSRFTDINILDIDTDNAYYNEEIMTMIKDNEWDESLLEEMYDEKLEISEITFLYKEIEYTISKNGVVSINYPNKYSFDSLFEYNFINKIIGLKQ